MPTEQFPQKPIVPETHLNDIDWIIKRLKENVPNLDEKTDDTQIIAACKEQKIFDNKPDEFYEILVVQIKAQIKP